MPAAHKQNVYHRIQKRLLFLWTSA